MPQLSEIKQEISAMSRVTLEMWQLTYRVFMEQDLDLISVILEKEKNLNKLEEGITAELVEFGRVSLQKKDKEKVTFYADIVGDLEMIGDYCKDILERVQIKIEEKLLFSDDAVKEYSDLYSRAEKALGDVVFAMEKDDYSLMSEVAKQDKQIDKLVDEYRKRHDQRMMDGVCTPLACNMFLNMLDFAASVYHHIRKIANNLNKAKR
ncbi:MAG: PhoU domain-containing protein [Candidatus Omnitrophota bacterium]|jgi:phosphate:Na+ symporter